MKIPFYLPNAKASPRPAAAANEAAESGERN